jgi:hypothetical protein
MDDLGRCKGLLRIWRVRIRGSLRSTGKVAAGTFLGAKSSVIARCWRLLAPLALLPTMVIPASPQTSTGGLHGQILDPTGAVITNATVTAEDRGGRKIEITSDQTGTYSFKGLPPGPYTVKVSAPSFANFTRKVTITADGDEKLDVSLHVATQHKEISVDSGEQEPNASDPGANVNSFIIKGKDLDALSDDPDELEAQLQALAGATAGPNGGQIYIDGFTGGKLPPKSAIKQIRINQNPFSAEFDKLGYGRIDIQTKPGGTKIHGRVLVDGSHSSFNARNPFVPQKPEYYTVLSAAMIEGPIGKKGAFSLVGEQRNINNSAAVNVVVLDASLNPVPFSQALPDPRKLTMLTPRLDFQLSPNNALFGRYQWYNSGENGAGTGQLSLGSLALNLHKTEHDLQLSDTQTLGPALVNEIRFEYRHGTTSQVPLDSSPQISVLGAFVGGGNSLGNVSTRQNYFEVHDNFSNARGAHFLRFGVRTRVRGETDQSTQNFSGTFTFSSLSAFQTTQRGLQEGQAAAQIRAAGGGASLFSIVAGEPVISDVSVDVGVYAQDDWRLRSNMTLSYGLRYETQNEIHDHADFAPRLGFAWGLGKKGSTPNTVLRAGFGLFYDRFGQNLLLNSRRLDGVHTRQFVVQSPDFFPAVPAISALSSSQVPVVYQIDPHSTSPYTMQTAVTLERKLAHNSTLAVTYLNSRGVNQLLSRNINTPLPGTFDPQNPDSGMRPLGNVGNVYQYESQGVFRQNQLTTNFSIRARSWLSLNGYYVFSHANSDTSGASSFPFNEYDVTLDYGRAAYDVHHRLAMFTSLDLPHGYILIPFVMATSGRPYDITVGRDLNGDSIFNDRPAFATDLSRPSVALTKLGAFDTSPIPGQKIIPANFADGPGLFNVNLRVTKAFAIGGHSESEAGNTGAQKPNASSNPFGGVWKPQYTLRFDVVVSNLFNHVNVGTPIGNLNSPLFGVANLLSPALGTLTNANRRINLQLQFLF